MIGDETFEDIFGDVVRLLTSEPMASPGAACLALAWHHRSLSLAG